MTTPAEAEIKEPVETEEIPKSELAALREKAAKHDSDGYKTRQVEKREKAIKDREDRAAQVEREKVAAELEAARDNPEELTAVQQRQRIRALELDLAKANQKAEALESEREEAEKETTRSRQEKAANEIATRLGVDSKFLLKVVPKLDADELEEYAKNLPKLGEEKTLTPASSRGRGSPGGLTAEMIGGMSPEERYAKRDEIAKLPLIKQ